MSQITRVSLITHYSVNAGVPCWCVSVRVVLRISDHHEMISNLSRNTHFERPELGKDNREDWFLKLNPLGKVPTIVRGDDVVGVYF